MKAKLIFLAVILAVLFSCSLKTSFEVVSQPYFDKYGPADVEQPLLLDGIPRVAWVWIPIQHRVEFLYSDFSGWSVYYDGTQLPPGNGQ
jgi:hypothetical protein